MSEATGEAVGQPPPLGPGAPALRALLEGKRRFLLMLDYDGTLAPFREDRDAAFPYPGVRESLATLQRKPSSRVVIITGRAVSDLIPLLGLDPPPEIWGSHGWERRFPDGGYAVGPFPEGALRGLANADEWVRLHGLEERCERKPGSVALHWRGLGEAAAREIEALGLKAWEPLEAEHGLEVHPFDGGIELRVPGRNKGDAVRTLLAETSQDAAAAYLGDDWTDEDAFEALDGRGLSALVRPAPRTSLAQVWIRPPGELIAFLDAWANA